MIGEQIRAHRKERAITQEQLAEVMGVSVAAISKWETGQSAPELTALIALADYFEVSVDTLLDHVLPADRREALLNQMEAHCAAARHAEAAETAELLLRRYPNDAEAVKDAASLFYKLHMFTGDTAYLRRSIDLTKRLFVLEKDPTGLKRFELMSSLGNQYALLEEWDTAEKYYRESNLSGVNDFSLANILTNTGKHREAVPALSKLINHQVYDLICSILSLQNCWTELGEKEKAMQTLHWGMALLNSGDSSLRREFSLLGTAMSMSLACLKEEAVDEAAADAAIQEAIRYAEGFPEEDPNTFLQTATKPELLHSVTDQKETLMQWLESSGNPRLVKITKETMK